MPDQPNCCICGEPCEPWPGRVPPHGYGNNPAPFGESDFDRACNTCNDTKVIPARLGLLPGQTLLDYHNKQKDN